MRLQEVTAAIWEPLVEALKEPFVRPRIQCPFTIPAEGSRGWAGFLPLRPVPGWRHKTEERYRQAAIPLFGVRVGKSFDSYAFPLLLGTGIERLDLPVVFFGPFSSPLLGVGFGPSLECLPVLGIQGNGLGELVNRFL